MNKKILLIIILLNCISHAGITFNQNNYAFKVSDNEIEMYYDWNNYNRQRNRINFSIDKIDVAKSYIDFKRPNNEIVQSYIYNRLREDIKIINESQKSYNIILTKETGSKEFSFIIKGSIDISLMKIIKFELNKRQNLYLKEYFNQYYYLWNEDEKLISIDYSKITNIYIEKIKPVANAFKIKNNKNMYNKRIVINDIINFYQSIPYDTLLEDRGEGFSTPLKMLHENKGDCDTKLVAIASTIKALFPDVNIVAIVLPKHVLIGFNIPNNDNDLKIKYRNESYVLAETAGPGLIPIGYIAKESETYMRMGKYSIIQL